MQAPCRSRSVAVVVALVAIVSGCDLITSPAKRLSRAQTALAAGDFAAAALDLKILLQSRPDDAAARFALAEASFGLGDLLAADKELSRASALGIPATRTAPLHFRILLGEGHPDTVVAALQTSRADLDEQLRLRYLAQALTAVGRPADAIAAFGAEGSLDAASTLVLAEAQAANGRTALALETLDHLAEDHTVAGRRDLLRGEILLRTGMVQAALSAMTQAARESSQSRDAATWVAAESAAANANLALGRTGDARASLARLEAARPNAIAARLLSGRIALLDHRLDAAEDAFGQVVRAAPMSAQAKVLFATALAEQGKLGQAESQLLDALEVAPDNQVVRRMLAEIQLRQGRPDSAQRTIERLDPDASTDPATLLVAARTSMAQGDRDAALRDLERADVVASSDQGLRIEFAATYLQLGLADRALALLDRSPQNVGTDHRSALIRALALVAQDHRDEARRSMDEYASQHAKEADAQNMAGLFFSVIRDPDSARKHYQAALALAPSDVRALRGLAQVEFGSGRIEEAETQLRRWIALKVDGTAARLAMAQVLESKGDTLGARKWLEEARAQDSQSVEVRVLLARAYATDGTFEPARAAIAEGLALDARRPALLVTAAQIEESAGDLARAAEYLRRASESSPSAFDIWVDLGRVELLRNNTASARDAFARALRLKPTWWPAIEGFALAKERDGDRAGVAATVAELKSNSETRYEGFILEGRIAVARGHYADALTAFNRALEIHPDERTALLRYRTQVQGSLPGAVEDLRAWLDKRPADVDARRALAQHLQGTGDRQGAIKELEILVAAKPSDSVALNNLAWAYFEAGDQRALPTARAAELGAPGVPAIADTLGWILVNSGKVTEGLPYLRRAATGTPEPEVLYHYAESLAKSGDSEGASHALESAYSAKGAFPSKAQADALRSRLGHPGSS